MIAGDSTRLTPEQLERLRRQVWRHLDYFRRLEAQTQKRHWPPDDPLADRVTEARAAVERLHFAITLPPDMLRQISGKKPGAEPQASP